MEPIGTQRTDPVSYADLRVEKTFPFGGSRSAGVLLDLFNLNNQGVISNASRSGVIEASGTSFSNPNVWLSPRLARLGFRLVF